MDIKLRSTSSSCSNIVKAFNIRQPQKRNTDREKTPNKNQIFASNEELRSQVINQKAKINQLELEVKHLKTKLSFISSKKTHLSQSSISSKITKLTPDQDKQKIFASYLELFYESNYLKMQILKQKKLIKELLKYPPPEYTEIYETYLNQCKTIDILKKGLQSSKLILDPNPRKSSLMNIVFPHSSYFIQGELEVIENICKSLIQSSQKSNLELEEVWYVMNPNNKPEIVLNDFIKGCRALNLLFSEQDLELVFQFFLKKGNSLGKSDLLSSLSQFLNLNSSNS